MVRDKLTISISVNKISTFVFNKCVGSEPSTHGQKIITFI